MRTKLTAKQYLFSIAYYTLGSETFSRGAPSAKAAGYKGTEMTHITEIIPDDAPEWAIEAMAEGRLFSTACDREYDAFDAGKNSGFFAGVCFGSILGSIVMLAMWIIA